MEGMSHIEWMESVDSTNSEVRRRFETLDNLSVIAAVSQTAGRGQGDHTWHSRVGVNLTFSLLLKFGDGFSLASRDQIAITYMMTLSLLSYLRNKNVKARIKWPNDIWVDDRKICGILIENVLTGPEMKYSIVGVGLNINETDFPSDLPNPTSLAILTGRDDYDIREELELMHKEICRFAGMIPSEDGRKMMEDEFNRFVFRLHE